MIARRDPMIPAPVTLGASTLGFAPSAAIAAGGLYNMSNAATGIMDALNETNSPGLAEVVGGALGGDIGGKTGRFADTFSTVSGGVKAAINPKSLNDYLGIADWMNSMSNDYGNSQSCP